MDLVVFLPLLIILGAFMFFASRRQKKAMQATIDLHNSLKVGDRVHTTSGLQATITGITDDTVDLEIAPGVVTTWMKLAVRDRIVDDIDDDIDDDRRHRSRLRGSRIDRLPRSPIARTPRLTAEDSAQARTLCGADELISKETLRNVASSSAPVHPARYLALFLVLLVGVYLLVFLTGDKQAKPKLGIDLQGGTRVTLTARTPDGSAPTPRGARPGAADHQRARQRPRRVRVRGRSSTAPTWSSPCRATTAARPATWARRRGCTSGPVIHVIPAQGQGQQPPSRQRRRAHRRSAGHATGRTAGSAGHATGRTARGARAWDRSGRAGRARVTAVARRTGTATGGSGTTAAAVSAGAAGHAGTGRTRAGGAADTGAAAAHTGSSACAGAPQPPEKQTLAQRIADEKQLRQSTDQQIQILALQFQATRCNDEDVLAGNDDPNLPLVTCSQDHKQVYLLDKSIISGEQIKNADSGLDQQRGEYVVDLRVQAMRRREIWADFTAANVGTQTAFVLDSQVVSAPEIQEAIPGGRTQITGQFTADSARELANVLKYGSLPLSFESSEAETVSATLGLTSLRAGLIAGAIGLALVLLYSLLYYRVLGLLTALSLVASGAMVFAILVLLGRYINYTLDLAGIAGLIIGIGTTADSFVVFFERIKDEIREGRSFRSAVPRGWARARKTILSGNAVTFLAAAVLYFLAVGQVKGFAFTLGLTTILDVVVVFLVTWPLVYLASKSPTLAKPAFNGLGAVQQIARERRAAAHATGRG